MKAKTTPGPRRQPWGESGRRGVYQTWSGRYQAKVRVGGRLVHVGMFDDPEEAGRAVERRLTELLGGAAT